MALSADLKSRILTSVRHTPAPTRQETLRRQTWLVGAGLTGALAVFFISGGLRPSSRPPLLIALSSLGTAILTSLAMWLSFTRRRTGLRRPPALLTGAVLLSTGAFVAWRHGLSALYGRAADWPDRSALPCLALGVATGSFVLCAALMSWRHSEPLAPRATGAAFGAAAGLGSALLVDLWCPVGSVRHLLVGHALPIPILALAGALIGARVLRMVRRRA